MKKPAPTPRAAAVPLARGVSIGGGRPLVFLMGPCAIEGMRVSLRAAKFLRRAAERAGVPLVFKSSYDKANRSSIRGYRGPGLEEGLRVLAAVKEETGLPVISDVHEVRQVEAAAGLTIKEETISQFLSNAGIKIEEMKKVMEEFQKNVRPWKEILPACIEKGQ